VTLHLSDLESSSGDAVLALMREVYGEAMSAAEFDWFFDRNPAGARILSVAEDGEGLAGALAMMPARALVGGKETPVAFAVHAVTRHASRGRGIFSRLMLRNEERAAEAGAALALGVFTQPTAGAIMVRKLGWRDLYRMRLWARPFRPLRALRRRGGGGLPASRGATLERFTDAQERAWRAVRPRWGNCLVRDAAYLNWRYLETPRDYRAFASDQGYAVVGHAVHKGVSAAVVCDLVGSRDEQRALLRRCLREARGGADAAIGVPAPGQRAAYLALGFVPTSQTIRVIGKPLRPDAELPTEWYFSLGDTDFF
jgi:GNAT superfamily N-acetyltransferase